MWLCFQCNHVTQGQAQVLIHDVMKAEFKIDENYFV